MTIERTPAGARLERRGRERRFVEVAVDRWGSRTRLRRSRPRSDASWGAVSSGARRAKTGCLREDRLGLGANVPERHGSAGPLPFGSRLVDVTDAQGRVLTEGDRVMRRREPDPDEAAIVEGFQKCRFMLQLGGIRG